MINLLHIVNALRSPALELKNIGLVTIFTETITVGNSAVTARCRIHGIEGDRLFKCYYHPKKNARAIYGSSYYPQELRLFTLGGRVEFADVLITEWVEGTPLDIVVASHGCDYGALSHAFDRMAIRLLEADYAHGDIKPENIICRPDGEMQLIDMDAMWHSGIEERSLDEYGTPAFNHPKRPLMRLGKHIDDYPLALLSTILATLALDAEGFDGALSTDNPLFNPQQIVCGKDRALNEAMMLLFRNGDIAHHAIATRLTSSWGVIDDLHQLLCRALDIDCNKPNDVSKAAVEYKPPKHTAPHKRRRTWSFEEEERLTVWLCDGESIATIATLLGRSEQAVRAHITKLKIKNKRRPTT